MSRCWEDVVPPEFHHLAVREGYQAGLRPAVLVVDMTRAFVEAAYPLAAPETGWPCAEAIDRLLEVAREAGIPVIYTRGASTPFAAERGVWRNSRNIEEVMMRDPGAHEIVGPLAPRPGDHVLTKTKPSAFSGTHLAAILTYYGVDTLLITGMYTSGCVRATAVDAFSLNYQVLIPEPCVADKREISHKVSLFDLAASYADVVELHDAMEYLKRAPKPPGQGAEA